MALKVKAKLLQEQSPETLVENPKNARGKAMVW